MSTRSHQNPVAARFARLSLAAKGVLVVSLPLIALLVSAWVFYQFEKQTRRAEAWVTHTYDVRSEIRRVLIRMANAEGAARGYLLTGQESLLDPYVVARREVPEPLESLRRLLGDSPPQLERLARVQSLVIDAFASLEALRREAAENRRATFDRLEAGGAVLDRLRRELRAMESEEDRLLVERRAQHQKAQTRQEMAIFGGCLLGLLGGVISALIFTTGIVERVRRLEEDTERLTTGQPIANEIVGSDEIARLHRTLLETSRLLARQGSQLREAHGELEDRVEQRTTELEIANEQLRQANEMSQAVIHSSPLAIWSLDLDGNVTFANPAAEKIFGWSNSEVIGQPLPIIGPDQQDEHRSWLERFRAGESVSGVERTRIRKDASGIEVVIWSAPLRDASGRIDGTIIIHSDVTERKLLEEQFRQSQKLEAVGRLAGGVAHDFNNLLTVITGYTEMLIAEAKQSPNLLDYANEVQHAANRAGALTAQLLAFSRRQISQPKILDLNDVVSHSTKLLRRLIGEDIEIETHLQMGLGKIKADPIHIDQVIMNLVVNARDAMSGGGKLTIETANARLDPEYVGRHIGVQPGPYCMLAIGDTGTGMDQQTRNRLFEPFFTTKEAGKGTGLGLSIVYGIVKQNGGEIMVYSEPGKGTVFKIYFPMTDVPAEFGAVEATPLDTRGSETVLICEDEEGIRKLVRAMLAKQGYRVMEASEPEEAIELLKRTPDAIDLLLTDIVMPKMNGFELAKIARDVSPHMKVLYMSGYTDNQVSRTWVLDPDTPFIQKPFTVAALGQKVREALRGSAAAK